MAPTRTSTAAPRRGAGLAAAAAAAAAACAALIAACASPQLDAQWADPERAAGALRGARVLVACEASEAVIRQICQDRLAAEVVARGATLVMATAAASSAGSPDERYLQAARDAGARAVLTSHIAPYGSRLNPGFSVGIGGFGMSRGGFGAGVGVSAPLGGGQIATGYLANTRLTDVRTGRLIWSARASAPPSQDVQTQLAELTRTLFASADKLDVF